MIGFIPTLCLEMKPHGTGNRVAIEQTYAGNPKLSRAARHLFGMEPEDRKLNAERVWSS